MNLSRGWKLKIRNKMLLTLVFAVSSSWAIPEGWYIDSFQKHPEIVKWSKNFDESVVFRKNHDGYDSVVYFGRFDMFKDIAVCSSVMFRNCLIVDFLTCCNINIIHKISCRNSQFLLNAQ